MVFNGSQFLQCEKKEKKGNEKYDCSFKTNF